MAATILSGMSRSVPSVSALSCPGEGLSYTLHQLSLALLLSQCRFLHMLNDHNGMHAHRQRCHRWRPKCRLLRTLTQISNWLVGSCLCPCIFVRVSVERLWFDRLLPPPYKKMKEKCPSDCLPIVHPHTKASSIAGTMLNFGIYS